MKQESLISDGLAEAYTLISPTGSIEITSNGTVDVAEYASAVVNVPGITPTGSIEITSNGTVDVTNYASAVVNVDGSDYATINFNLPASPPTKSVAPSLSEAKYKVTAATVGNYALFIGGRNTSDSADSFSTMVNVYDSTLTKTLLPPLDPNPTTGGGMSSAAATTVGNYALFGGGLGHSSYYYDVLAYSTNLTKTSAPYLSESRHSLAATTVGNYALFGGGQKGAGSASDWLNTVDAYNQILTKVTSPAPLSETKSQLAATTVGNYALFGGGYDREDTVDAYNQASTKVTSPAPLSEGRDRLAATTVGNYALFGGGYGGGSGVYSSVVDAYDQTSTKVTSPAPLSEGRCDLAATTVGDYALFGGGDDDALSTSYFNVVDAYDTRLTKTTPTELSRARGLLAATTVENYALFGGGKVSNGLSTDVVDAYSVEKHDVQLFPGTKYSFNGTAESTSSTWQTISVVGNLTGYMKVKNVQIN